MDIQQHLESEDELKAIRDYIFCFQDSFRTSAFSDFKIVTKDQEFKVHKLVICAQSDFFADLFEYNWKGADENVARLTEDDPKAVEAMIRYMYGFGYPCSDGGQQHSSSMEFHLGLYRLGDKYAIPSLKEHARKKFEVAIQTGWNMDHFPEIIKDVYSNVFLEDRDLQDSLVDVSLQHIDSLLEREDFLPVLRDTVGFAADLVYRQGQAVANHKCRTCHEQYDFAESVDALYCPFCGSRNV